MKFGMRTPNIKKSIMARTTGKAKRVVQKAIIPGYEKKDAGWIKKPKRAAYNKVYNKTSFSIKRLFSRRPIYQIEIGKESDKYVW